MAWQPPKLDWSPSDYLNAADTDRIEGNTQYLADLMAQKYPPVPSIQTVVGRDMQTIDFADTFNRIEQNLDALRQAFFTPPGWQPVRTDWAGGAPFDWSDVQRLESNLKRLYYYLTNSDRYTRYSGQFYAGEAANSL